MSYTHPNRLQELRQMYQLNNMPTWYKDQFIEKIKNITETKTKQSTHEFQQLRKMSNEFIFAGDLKALQKIANLAKNSAREKEVADILLSSFTAYIKYMQGYSKVCQKLYQTVNNNNKINNIKMDVKMLVDFIKNQGQLKQLTQQAVDMGLADIKLYIQDRKKDNQIAPTVEKLKREWEVKLKETSEQYQSKIRQQEAKHRIQTQALIERIQKQKQIAIKQQKKQMQIVKNATKLELQKIEKQKQNKLSQLNLNVKSVQQQLKKQIKINQTLLNQKQQQLCLNGRSLAFWQNIFQGYQPNSYKTPEKSFVKQRDFLLKSLQGYCKKRVARTKLLYALDVIEYKDFHRYADNISNYVVIAKLKNGHIVAAYAEQGLSQQHNGKPGLIASLTNQISIEIDLGLEGARTTSYNPFFIVFGNDQFRIQPNKKEFTSYVGYQYSYFRPKITQNDLMGVESQVTEVTNFEIHKVIFQAK